MNSIARLEPFLWKLAQFLAPPPTTDTEVTSPLGIRMRLPAGYRDARSVALGLFQGDETRLFRNLVSTGMSVVDLGAYIGYFTLLAAHLAGPFGRVYAFEPDMKAFQYLLTNVELNSWRNIVAVNKAASSSSRKMTLVRDKTGPESFVTTSQVDGDTVAIQATGLDEFFAAAGWPPVDVVKMNIEGSEGDALQGMPELSGRNPHLKLIMEFNPKAMARAGVSRLALTSTLTDLGFKRSSTAEQGLKPIPSGELLPTAPAVCNVLLTKW